MNVIFVIAGSAILLYCLWGKKTRKIAIIISGFFAFIMAVVTVNESKPEVFDVSNREIYKPQLREFNFKAAYMARAEGVDFLEARSIILNKKPETETKTSYEKGAAVLALIGFFIIFGFMLLRDLDIKENIRKIQFRLIGFFLCFLLYLMSLYLGLSIPYLMAAPRRQMLRMKRVFL